MGLKIEQIELLLLVAALVAIAARYFRVPYTVGLVLAGTALAISPIKVELSLTRELIFKAFLPPLVFEAAFYMSWSEFRRDLPVLLTLAVLGVLLVAALTAAGMHYLAGWEWIAALLFGVLISATDPVSVIATFKQAGLSGRLCLLVEGESLLNDGTAAVLFAAVLAVMEQGGASATGVAQALVVTSLGGMFFGLLVGGGALLLAGRTEDHLVEITFTTVAAYGSFLVAEQFHCSGVFAALAAGLLVGNLGSLGAISDPGREAVSAFWEYMAFVVNSLIFLLIGLRLAHYHFGRYLLPILAAIGLVLVGRAVSVYLCCALFARSRRRVPRRYQLVLFWGGLRGALALALVLSLPAATPHREAIVTVTFAVVAFTVVVPGLTITPLLRWLGEVRDAGSDGEKPSRSGPSRGIGGRAD